MAETYPQYVEVVLTVNIRELDVIWNFGTIVIATFLIVVGVI